MKLINFEKLSDAGVTFASLPIPRQIAILLALAMSIGIGIISVNWITEPDMSSLFLNIDDKDMGKITEVLEKSNIKYSIDGKNINISKEKIFETRMKLASLGLPANSNIGYELFDKPSNLSSTQFSETVKYKRSIEGELSKTISSLEGIMDARVHIATPKQNSLVSRNTNLSASVMVNVNKNQELSKNQILGIIHLVSSSVPGLKNTDVTLVDQRGALLSDINNNEDLKGYSNEAAMTLAKERELEQKIIQLITPIVGPNGIKANVALSLDFTLKESKIEKFDNNNNIKYEQIIADTKSREKTSGIPGALSNNTEKANKSYKKNEDKLADENKFDKLNRNYELDREVIYLKDATGKINHISVAVVLNDKLNNSLDDYVPLTEDEVKKIENLIKNSIGFNSERGDSITVVHSPFVRMVDTTAYESKDESIKNILTSPEAAKLIKILAAVIIILSTIFIVLRPIVSQLRSIREEVKNSIKLMMENEKNKTLLLPEPDTLLLEKSNYVRDTSKKDTKKAAKVLMNWLDADE